MSAEGASFYSGVRGRAPSGNNLDFLLLESPFLFFRVIQIGYWPNFNLKSVFIIKIWYIMKNVTDFRKTVETGVDPCLLLVCCCPYRTTSMLQTSCLPWRRTSPQQEQTASFSYGCVGCGCYDCIVGPCLSSLPGAHVLPEKKVIV